MSKAHIVQQVLKQQYSRVQNQEEEGLVPLGISEYFQTPCDNQSNVEYDPFFPGVRSQFPVLVVQWLHQEDSHNVSREDEP